MIVAADSITATRPSVRRILDARDGEALAALCLRLVERGASWLDLNPGRVRRGEREDLWRWLVATAEDACNATLMIDTPDPDVMEMALGACSRPPVLNFATAERHRLERVLDLAGYHRVVVVAATMTRRVPRDAEERLALASVIVEEASRRGIEGERLVLDPMVMPLAMPGGESHARAVVEVVRAVGGLFDQAPCTLAALSNLCTRSSGARSSIAAAPFLHALWGAGLGVALADVLDDGVLRAARMCQVFDGNRLWAPAEHEPNDG